jgi:hypothetical protein
MIQQQSEVVQRAAFRTEAERDSDASVQLDVVAQNAKDIVTSYALDATRGDARAGAIVDAAERVRKTATTLSRIPRLVTDRDVTILRDKIRDLRELVETDKLFNMMRSVRD